jgi:hypothetical protein
MAAQAKHLMSSTLLLSLLTLAGCNKPVDPQQPKVALAPTAQPAQPYTPPTAEQLSQMVAPIALFPDKLVGQVLAGATYPAQISEADQWLAQNPSLKGDALQSAEANQPWDVSVKSLTAFPSVLDQMAANPQWTTSLGQAYANDPNDVMNAIQVMRQRAQQAGNLKTTPKLRVSTTLRATPPPDYIDEPPPDQVVYAGPAVIPPPPQTIIIEPAEPDVVYVPQYNPTVVYGEPVAVYPGWRYREPAYVGSDLVTTGAITFGIGVLVGAAFSHHHDYGWNSWGVNWGGPAHGGGGWHRPAVVYNNNTYISKSVTVNNYGPRGGALAAHAQPPMRPAGPPPMPMQPRGAGPMAMQPHPSGPMTMPHFTRHDAVPGARPPMMAAQHGAGPQGAGQPDFRQPPHMAQQMQPHGASTMHMPQTMQQRQPAQQLAQQHNQPGQEHARFGEQRPTAQQHGSANMANQLGAQQHNPAVQQHQQAQQQQQLQQEHNMAQRQAAQQQQQQQQRLHEQQRQQMASRQPPAMHADAGAAHAAMPHRDANPPERAQAHVMHQEAQAMPARPAGPPQPSHEQRQAPRHEQAAHQEQHDKHEHHG